MFQKLIYLLHAMSPIVNCDKLYSLLVKDMALSILWMNELNVNDLNSTKY
jgi:hypothetical protein